MLRQAQHERGGVVHKLIRHPDTPSSVVSAVDVDVRATDWDDVLLTFVVTGADRLLLPERVSADRTDGLWRTTCFEMFWRPAGAVGYFEFNFSPSTRWAAYAFDGYREGMRDLPLQIAPHIGRDADHRGTRAAWDIDVDLSDLPRGPALVGFSAVIEETDGTKSYWALAHPSGAFDFHHEACFALEVPALGRP